MPPFERLVAACRTWAGRACVSPDPTDTSPPTPRIAWIVAAALGAWIFGYKLRAFLNLTTSSDLYQFTQLATTWLDGRFLQDNCYGYHLAIHTYFFCPILALLAWPFGSVGLLMATGLAAAAATLGMVKLLRVLDVPDVPAVILAAAATAMPLSLHVYQDALYGFHVELLLPAMAIWLGYFLVRRRWLSGVFMAIVLISVKEDAPLLACAVAALVYMEDALRDAFRDRPGTGFRSRVNGPAVAVAALGLVALPLLLYVLRLNAPGAGAAGGFDRLRIVGDARLGDGQSLFQFVFANLGEWLTAAGTTTWLRVALVATFGLVVFRPHALLVGLVLTLISWLMKDDALWSPRYAPSLAFLQLVTAFGFASVWSIVARLTAGQPWRRMATAVATGLVVVVCAEGFRHQLGRVPHAAEVYAMQPAPTYTAKEIAQADALFATYRAEGRRDEPVIASTLLFRYAHDRNLLWFDRLANRPAPIWILWDDEGIRPTVDVNNYALLGRRGRFSLYKKAGA